MMRISFLSFVICFVACHSGDQKEPYQNTDSISKPSNVVVLCDVSSSNTLLKNDSDYRKQINYLSDKCVSLIHEYPVAGSTLYFYGISETASPRAFATFTVEEKLANNGNDIETQESGVKSNIYRSLDSMAVNADSNTCILTSIDQAYNLLAQLSQPKSVAHNNDLIIFSDMIEECKTSGCCNIQMDKKSKEILPQATVAKIENYHTGKNFDSLGIQLKIYLTTPVAKGSGINTAAKNSLETIWRKIFSNYGYKKANDPSYIIFKQITF